MKKKKPKPRNYRKMAEAIYAVECKRLGKEASRWDTHEEDCLNYWETVIKLGIQAWWHIK